VLPPAFDSDRALADVHWLVEDVGPRKFQSAEEGAAVAGVLARLETAGWQPKMLAGSPIACRGTGSTLFLAHVDSVPMSPGAVDNAAGVAILLELARSSEASNLCLGFPIGEEVGLVGSEGMSKGWASAGLGPLNLVVSLDLIGEGTPTAVDLSRAWGSEELRWLGEHTTLDVPYLYRAFGRALPQWRSDHAHFAVSGVLSFQIMTRGKDVVFTRYHQQTDSTVDPAAMVATASALEGMAKAKPPSRGDPDPALPLLGVLIPGSVVWSTIGLGLLSAAQGLPRARDSVADLARLACMVAVAAVAMTALTHIGFPSHEAEMTAAATMGQSATGWWAAAPWAVGLAWIAWLGVWRVLPGSGHPAFIAGVFTLGALMLDPIIALPFAVAALLVRIHPLFGLLPAIILIRPEPLRELAFHGLLAPWMWPVLFVLSWPAIGRIRRR
jgi:hypothetical protein